MAEIPMTAEEINYHLVRIATADDGPFTPGRAKGWGLAPEAVAASYAKRRMAWDSKNSFAAWKPCGVSIPTGRKLLRRSRDARPEVDRQPAA